MTWTHEHSWTLAAPPATVFAAFGSADQLTRWFAEHAEIGGRVGEGYRFWGRHTLGTPSRSEAKQVVTAFEPGQRLGYTWDIRGCPTEVSVALVAAAQGSRLTLRHRIDGDLGGPRQKELIDDLWRLSVGNLALHLAGGTDFVLPDFADPAPEVRLTVILEAPCDVVWRALIEPEALKQWVGSPGLPTVDPRVGGRYEFGWVYQVDGRTVAGGPTRILEFEPGRKLVVDWPDWRGDATVAPQTLTWVLEPVGGATRLTLTHGGFARPTDISDYPFGWREFISELTKVCLRLDPASPSTPAAP